jgi:hypothetical protein
MLQAGAKPHDVGCVLKEPGWPPLVMKWGDSATDKISPNHLKGEPGLGKAMDSGGGNRELLVVGVEITPLLTTSWQAPTNPAELLRILLLNP